MSAWQERLNADYDLRASGKNWVSSTGADPELFLLENGSNTLLPAFEVLPPKQKALKTIRGNAAFYNDGFQAEFRLIGVHSCHDVVVGHIAEAISAVSKKAREVNAHISLHDVMPIPPQSKVEYAKHLALGCAPSLNAYGKPPLHVESPSKLPIRFAGGHIHFGLANPRIGKEAYIPLVKALDAISGVMGVHLGHSLCSPERRQFYGVAGEYRTPAHGLEYRTLSPYWLATSQVAYFTLDLARKVVNQALLNTLKWNADEDQVQTCINSNNPQMALEILQANAEELKYLIWACYTHLKQDSVRNFVNALLEKGLNLLVKDPEAVALNWGLSETNEAQYSKPRVQNFIALY